MLALLPDGRATFTVSAAAADLDAWLWNRPTSGPVSVDGDAVTVHRRAARGHPIAGPPRSAVAAHGLSVRRPAAPSAPGRRSARRPDLRVGTLVLVGRRDRQHLLGGRRCGAGRVRRAVACSTRVGASVDGAGDVGELGVVPAGDVGVLGTVGVGGRRAPLWSRLPAVPRTVVPVATEPRSPAAGCPSPGWSRSVRRSGATTWCPERSRSRAGSTMRWHPPREVATVPTDGLDARFRGRRRRGCAGFTDGRRVLLLHPVQRRPQVVQVSLQDLVAVAFGDPREHRRGGHQRRPGLTGEAGIQRHPGLAERHPGGVARDDRFGAVRPQDLGHRPQHVAGSGGAGTDRSRTHSSAQIATATPSIGRSDRRPGGAAQRDDDAVDARVVREPVRRRWSPARSRTGR